MKKRVLAILMALMTTISMAGCGGASSSDTASSSEEATESEETEEAEETTEETETSTSAEALEIAFVCPITAGDTNWNNALAGMEAACEEIGYSVNMVGPASLDLEQWVKDMDTAISTGYDLIITTGVSDVILSGIERAVDAGIPVCLIDTDAADSGRFSYIGLDNYSLGYALAEQVGEMTGGEASVCLIGMDITANNYIDRMDGFDDCISEKYPDITVVTTQSASDAATAADVTGQVINGYPEIDCFVGLDGTVPKGIAQTLTERELTDDYTATALSIDQQVLDYIRSGGLDGGIGLDYYTMGYQAVYNCQAYMTDGEYEEVTIPDSVPVTADNADEYATDNGLE